MPNDPDDLGLPLNANGAAYTSSQARHGVSLNYVAEKLGTAIEDLHREWLVPEANDGGWW